MLSFIQFCFSYNFSNFQLFRKESVVMAVKHAKFTLFVIIADDKDFSS